MRVSTSTRSSSGSSVASWAALAGCRCARISAIVCGCSPRMNFESCCGSARSSEAKPAFDWNARITRSIMRRAVSGPKLLISTRLANSMSPRATCSAATRGLVELLEHLLAHLGRDAAEGRHLAEQRLDLVLGQVLEDAGGGVFTDHQRDDRGLPQARHRGLDVHVSAHPLPSSSCAAPWRRARVPSSSSRPRAWSARAACGRPSSVSAASSCASISPSSSATVRGRLPRRAPRPRASVAPPADTLAISGLTTNRNASTTTSDQPDAPARSPRSAAGSAPARRAPATSSATGSSNAMFSTVTWSPRSELKPTDEADQVLELLQLLGGALGARDGGAAVLALHRAGRRPRSPPPTAARSRPPAGWCASW